MSEFLLGSGFGEPADGDNQATQEDLKDAIINALMTSDLLPDEDLQKLFGNEQTLNEFLEKVIERLMNEGFIQTAQNGTGSMDDTEGQGEAGGSGAPVKFELSEKGTDFLGYRALRELMGALGRSSFGSHDTQDLSTGVDASGPSKAVRVRRHPESRRERDPPQHHPSDEDSGIQGRRGSRRRLRRPRGASDRVPIVVRHRGHARLLALDDPLRRRPLHAGQEGGTRPIASAANPVSRATRCAWSSSTTPPRRFPSPCSAR